MKIVLVLMVTTLSRRAERRNATLWSSVFQKSEMLVQFAQDLKGIFYFRNLIKNDEVGYYYLLSLLVTRMSIFFNIGRNPNPDYVSLDP